MFHIGGVGVRMKKWQVESIVGFPENYQQRLIVPKRGTTLVPAKKVLREHRDPLYVEPIRRVVGFFMRTF